MKIVLRMCEKQTDVKDQMWTPSSQPPVLHTCLYGFADVHNVIAPVVPSAGIDSPLLCNPGKLIPFRGKYQHLPLFTAETKVLTACKQPCTTDRLGSTWCAFTCYLSLQLPRYYTLLSVHTWGFGGSFHHSARSPQDNLCRYPKQCMSYFLLAYSYGTWELLLPTHHPLLCQLPPGSLTATTAEAERAELRIPVTQDHAGILEAHVKSAHLHAASPPLHTWPGTRSTHPRPRLDTVTWPPPALQPTSRGGNQRGGGEPPPPTATARSGSLSPFPHPLHANPRGSPPTPHGNPTRRPC